MATDKSFMQFVAEQMREAGNITYRPMFGEYAVYCAGKVVALVCDNRLYIKPTEAGRRFIGDVREAPPYPGAKMYFLIEDNLEDVDWLSELVRTTARELPPPKEQNKKHR